MKKKNKIVLGIVLGVVLLVIIGVIAFIATSDLRQVVTLRSEVEKLSKIDITKDDIDMTIKTTGEYAVVEQTIKDYMNTYASNTKQLEKILDDDKISEILSAENYKNDGPDFIESRKYINETKSSFNEKMNTLIEMTNEEFILKATDGKKLNENMIELYKELMLGNELGEDLQETVQTLKEASDSLNKVFDVQEKIINMLIANKDKWKINNEDQIEFLTEKMVDEYNGYLNEL